LEKNKSNLRTPDEINDNLYKEKVRPGAQIYNFYCRSCHQGNGMGDENRFPPLAGADWVTGDTKRLLNVILNGLNGPLTINEKSYNNIMPKHDFLKDEDVVELVNYIRTHFGNNASNINLEQVQAVRKAH
jgi:mono/diheme cytochrome c family protein